MKDNKYSEDLLLCNGYFETFDDEASVLRWLHIRGDQIVAIGQDELPDLKEAKYLDLSGAYVVPGFIDNHVHLVQSGINKISTSLKGMTTVDEIKNCIQHAHSINTPHGKLIYLNGFEESALLDGKQLTRWVLDEVSPDDMIWINSVEYQTSIVNTKAYKFLKFHFNTKGIIRDEEDRPTGVLKNKASLIARRWFLNLIPDSYRKEGVEKVCLNALSKGLTTLVAMEGGFLFRDEDAEFLHGHLHKLPVDVELFFQTTNIEKVVEMGLDRIGGNIMLDGSIQSRTAALRFPYEDDFETRGHLFFTDEELKNFVFKAIDHKLEISLHAVGTRAISQALHVYYQASMVYGHRLPKLRIEHFELPSNEEIEMAAKLGVYLSMQPSCNLLWGGATGTYEKRLGEKRRLRANPIASILAHTDKVVSGSESDLTPLNPMVGIFSMVNHQNPSESISPIEALKLYTVYSARSLGLGDIKGEIKCGKKADLAVLDKSLRTVAWNDIMDIKNTCTIKSGEILYRSDSC